MATRLLTHDAFQGFVARFPYMLPQSEGLGGLAPKARDFFDVAGAGDECYMYNFILNALPQRRLTNLLVQFIKVALPREAAPHARDRLLRARRGPRPADATREELAAMVRGSAHRQWGLIALLQSAVLA